MNRHLLSLIAAFALASSLLLVLNSCGGKDSKEENESVDLSVPYSSIKLGVGETKKIEVTSSKPGIKLFIKSADPRIVTVNEAGEAKGIKEGKTKIRISAQGAKMIQIDVEVEGAGEVVFPPKGSEFPCLVFTSKNEKDKERIAIHETSCNRKLVEEVEVPGLPKHLRIGFLNVSGTNKNVVAAIYGLKYGSGYINIALCKETLENATKTKEYLKKWGFGDPSETTEEKGNKILPILLWPKRNIPGLGEVEVKMMPEKIDKYQTNTLLWLRLYM